MYQRILKCSLILYSIFFCIINLNAQTVLDVYGSKAIQRMADGKTFRILEETADYEELKLNTTFTFNELQPSDTVIYYYSDVEDQLYVIGWDPSRIHKKHLVKFAVLWRISSKNPRFGAVSVPADFLFDGFVNSAAYFVNPATNETYEIYVDSHYNSGIVTVDYSIKGRKRKPTASYIVPYFRRTSPWNYSTLQIPNPEGPTLQKAMYEREEYFRDSLLSPKLAKIKTEYKQNKVEKNIDSEGHFRIIMASDSFVWQSYKYKEIYYEEIHLLISDQNYKSDKMILIFFSEHPEIIPERTAEITQYSYKNGIREFRYTFRHLPGIICKIKFPASSNVPVLLAEFDTNIAANVKQFISDEIYYKQDKNVQSISASKDPYVRFKTIWANYALEKSIRLSGEDLFYGILSVFEKDGLNLDDKLFLDSQPQTTRTATVANKFNSLMTVVVSLFPPVLNVRPTIGSYNWNEITFEEMNRLPNQEYRVFLARFSFPNDVNKYDVECPVVPEAPPVYFMFLSEPEMKK